MQVLTQNQTFLSSFTIDTLNVMLTFIILNRLPTCWVAFVNACIKFCESWVEVPERDLILSWHVSQWFNARTPVRKTGDLRFKSQLGHYFISQYLSYNMN